MKRLTIAPLHWSRLPDLRQVPPLDDDDLVGMGEPHAVLARHDRLGRFALHLVHEHFYLAPDEVLVEYSDLALHEQSQRVESRVGQALRNVMPTTRTLAEAAPVAVCLCAYEVDRGHLGSHRPA